MKLDVLAAGELYIDLVMSGFDRLPEPGQECFARDFRREPGGGAVITALGLAKLGAQVGIAGAVGAEDGGWLLDRISRGGVDISAVRSVDGEFTGTTLSVSDGSDRTLFTYAGANGKARDAIAGCTLQARHLHWAAPPDPEILARFRERGMSISLDIGFAHADARCLAALPLADLFFPNEVEAERLTGEKEPEAMLRALARAGARCVVVKLGPRGAAMLDDGRLLCAQPPSVTAVDTTGAGDCFNAGFLHAWLRSEPPAACLKLGNFCGALSTRALGGIAGFPAPEEIAWHLK